MTLKTPSISFLVLSIMIAYSTPSLAQSLVPTEGTLGIFSYTAQMPKSWNSTNSAFDRARETLAKDQVQLKPAFAYEGPKGNLVFGTWKELKPGVAFTVSQLNSDPPQFPEEWGISPSNLNSLNGATESGIEYSGFSVIGMGDGKNFAKGKPVKTFGVWYDLPISYQDATGTHSGLASIYYRATESESFPSSAGVRFAQNLLNNLKLSPGINKISADAYKASYSQNKPLGTQANKNLNDDKSSPKDSATADSKSSINHLVGILHNDKGIMYCFNYGTITQAPCSVAQIGSNKAEVNPAVIQQLNNTANQKY